MKRLLPGMLLLTVAASTRADLVATPTLVEFGYQAVNTTSAPRAVTLSNTGNQALTVTTLTLATGSFTRLGGSCFSTPITIAAQASCTLTYTFRPFANISYDQTHTVALADGTAVNFRLTGTGEYGNLEFSPSSLSFPPVPVGTAGSAQMVSLHNSRPVPLRITGITPTTGTPFERTGGTCPEPPTEFAAFGSCFIYYTFRPTQVGRSVLDLTTVSTTGTFTLRLEGDGLPEIPLFEDGFEASAPGPIGQADGQAGQTGST